MTTKLDIKDWFLRGVEEEATHMIIVCDTFDYGDYPVYAKGTKETLEKYESFNNKNMQRVVEVYDLRASMDKQVDSSTPVFRLPKI